MIRRKPSVEALQSDNSLPHPMFTAGLPPGVAFVSRLDRVTGAADCPHAGGDAGVIVVACMPIQVGASSS